MSDIRNAVNAGLTVTTHEKIIQYKGWHGSGYIIIDPNTGTGAYLIDGGADGGILPMIGGLGVGILFSIILASFGAAVTAGLGGLILLALAAIALAITAYYLWSNYTDDQRQCFWQGFDTGAILGGAGASSLVNRVSNALYTFQEAVLVARAQNIGAAIGLWTGIILGRFVPNNTVQGCWGMGL